MKDLLLIPMTLAVFALGYCMMTKVDRFIEENRRMRISRIDCSHLPVEKSAYL